MKTLSLFLLAVATTTATSCSKSASGPVNAGSWRLVAKYSVVVSSHTQTPAADSTVFLALNSDSSYTSRLNNQVIAQGSYTVSTDAVSHLPVLQLHNFKTTGIFTPFILLEIGTNNQVLSAFSGMYMHTSHDSLTLSGPLTPGGSTSYLFIKQ